MGYLCYKCATCGGLLDAMKPPVPVDAILTYFLVIDKEYYRNRDSRPEPDGRGSETADSVAAIKAFKKDLNGWLKKNNHNGKVKIVDKLTALAILFVECKQSTAKDLRSMPGVALMYTEQG